MREKTLKLLLRRDPNAHKYDFGHVLVIGGSPGMVGAPFLAGRAALRTGAGLVTIASHPKVIDKLEKRVEEIMTLRLPASSEEAVKALKSFIKDRKVSATVMGPGMSPEFAELINLLLPALDIPVVLDAGALLAFKGKLSDLKTAAQRNPGIVLTPHAGEYAKLTGQQPPIANLGQLTREVSRFASLHQVTLIFKRQSTLVAHPDGRVYENKTGNPGLATAGTGDVLSGVIVGLLTQKLPTAEATEAAVYLHGLAGDLAAKAKTQPGLIASDVIEFIPAALIQAESGPN